MTLPKIDSRSTTGASQTPRTMSCFREGKWHADELANVSDKMERELTGALQRVTDLEAKLREIDVLTVARGTDICDRIQSILHPGKE